MALTQARLKELLHYNPDTGEFTWKVSTSKRIVPGDPAGYRGTYVFIRIHGVLHRAHKLAWLYCYGVSPSEDLDHKDRNKHNNRIDNLREVTDSQNLYNASKSRLNTSGVKGVSWSKTDKRWRAYINVGGKAIHLGQFVTKDEAIQARRAGEVKHGVSEFCVND